MNCCWSYWYFLSHLILIKVAGNLTHIRSVDAQQDERIRLECTVSSKLDAEEAMWMRIRPPHNPDILTYRDSVVYAPDRIQLEQRRLSSSINANGTLIDTYFLTLTILRPNIDDEGRYICSRGKNIFAEYDLFIIVPPQFVDDNHFIQQGTVREGSTLHLTCSAHGRPKPSISWVARTVEGKHRPLNDGTTCQETVCELRLANYSRNDPSLIECIADNGKSTRVSKVFHVDVHYAPRLVINIRKFMGTRTIDLLLQCSTISNPPATISWLDEHRQPIKESSTYKIKVTNQSSTLSFIVSPQDLLPVIYYCHSSNSIGSDEKLIDVSELIEFDPKTIHETLPTIIISSTTAMLQNSTALKKMKTVRPNRARSRLSTTTIEILTTTSSIANSLTCFYPSSILSLIILRLIFCSV